MRIGAVMAVSTFSIFSACGGLVSALDGGEEGDGDASLLRVLPDAEVLPDADPACPPAVEQPGSWAACCQLHVQSDDVGLVFCPYCHLQTITGASVDRPGYCVEQPACAGVYNGVCP